MLQWSPYYYFLFCCKTIQTKLQNS